VPWISLKKSDPEIHKNGMTSLLVVVIKITELINPKSPQTSRVMVKVGITTANFYFVRKRKEP
jgi:uncharacterized membrane protein